jgi:hypothetical protein
MQIGKFIRYLQLAKTELYRLVAYRDLYGKDKSYNEGMQALKGFLHHADTGL